MSLAASRAVLRHSTFSVRRAGIRNASSTSEAAAAAKEKAAQAQSKASEGLSKVTSSAGSALSKAGSAASGALNSLASAGGTTGRLIGRIQCQYSIFEGVEESIGILRAHWGLYEDEEPLESREVLIDAVSQVSFSRVDGFSATELLRFAGLKKLATNLYARSIANISRF